MTDQRLHLQPTTWAPAARRPGFTLIEILIVVMILGIMAAIVVPQFSNATQVTRENTLKDQLRYMRSQIAVYAAQHSDGGPGQSLGSAWSAQLFVAQLTQYTDGQGNTSTAPDATHCYGPYLTSIPANPMAVNNVTAVVQGAGTPPTPDGSTGWIFNPQAQEIFANLKGNDQDGTPYVDY